MPKAGETVFWDSSALVPYLVHEDSSAEVVDLLADDRSVLIWWASSVECVSALERQRRDGSLEREAQDEAVARLRELIAESAIVQPTSLVRDRAERHMPGSQPCRPPRDPSRRM